MTVRLPLFSVLHQTTINKETIHRRSCCGPPVGQQPRNTLTSSKRKQEKKKVELRQQIQYSLITIRFIIRLYQLLTVLHLLPFIYQLRKCSLASDVSRAALRTQMTHKFTSFITRNYRNIVRSLPCACSLSC